MKTIINCIISILYSLQTCYITLDMRDCFSCSSYFFTRVSLFLFLHDFGAMINFQRTDYFFDTLLLSLQSRTEPNSSTKLKFFLKWKFLKRFSPQHFQHFPHLYISRISKIWLSSLHWISNSIYLPAYHLCRELTKLDFSDLFQT